MLKSFFRSFRRVTTGGNFIPEIDGLRFLALLPVVMMHANTNYKRTFPESLHIRSEYYNHIINGGEKGVWIFFALSGFILSYSFAKHFYINNLDLRQFQLKSYYLRRITRLEPPFIVSTLVLFCFSVTILSSDFSELIWNLLSTLTYSHHIIYGYWSPINPVTWSLEVEIQFYLFAPFIGCFFFKMRENFRNYLLLLLITCVPLVILSSDMFINPHLKRSLPVFLHHFLAGILVSSIYTGRYWALIKSKSFTWDIVGILCLVLIFIIDPRRNTLYLHVLFDLALVGTIISAFKSKWLNELFSNKIITTIGGMCYSIYLLHYAIIFGVSTLTKNIVVDSPVLNYCFHMGIALIAVLFISLLFFKYCEKPFMYKNWPLETRQRLTELFSRKKERYPLNK